MLFPISMLARVADATDISDLTESVRTGPAAWVEGGLEIPFDVDPSPAEAEAIAIRLTAVNVNDETIRRRASASLASNVAWRSNAYPDLVAGADQIIGSPAASVVEKNLARGIKSLAHQLDATTAQNNGLIRLVLQRLDATD